MPTLIRLYIHQSIAGFGIAAVFVGVLLWFNVANLWYLVTHTEAGPLAVFLLWAFNGLVFAGVQFGIAIMRLQGDAADGGQGGHRLRTVPVPVQPAKRRL